MSSPVLATLLSEFRAWPGYSLTLGDALGIAERLLHRAVREGHAHLGQGCLETTDEARWLILGGLGLDVRDGNPPLEQRLLPGEHQRLADLLEQRLLERIPTAYLLGEAWLAGHRFCADARAIIPRSVISELLADPHEALLPEHPYRILDLCCGGASLAILAALRWPDADVIAADLSAEALAQARENLQDYGLQDRVQLRQGSLFEAIEPADGPFDLILCNPPYVPTAKVDAYPAEFRREPDLAHRAGPDGQSLIEQILLQAPEHLGIGGMLIVEVGREAEATERLAARLDLNPPLLWLDSAAEPQSIFVWDPNS